MSKPECPPADLSTPELRARYDNQRWYSSNTPPRRGVQLLWRFLTYHGGEWGIRFKRPGEKWQHIPFAPADDPLGTDCVSYHGDAPAMSFAQASAHVLVHSDYTIHGISEDDFGMALGVAQTPDVVARCVREFGARRDEILGAHGPGRKQKLPTSLSSLPVYVDHRVNRVLHREAADLSPTPWSYRA